MSNCTKLNLVCTCLNAEDQLPVQCSDMYPPPKYSRPTPCAMQWSFHDKHLNPIPKLNQVCSIELNPRPKPNRACAIELSFHDMDLNLFQNYS